MSGGDATVGIAGSGPAAEAVEAAVGDADAETDRVDPDDAAGVDLAVVVGRAGDPSFERADRAAGRPWIAVELGGIGGRGLPGVDAAVSVLDPGGGCFDCLRQRVTSNLGEPGAVEPRTTRSDARLAGAHAGRLAVALLAGEDAAGRVIEIPHAERRLVPVPGCGCDTGRDRALRRGFVDVALDEAIDRADRAVDGRLGIVRSVGESESFPAPYYLATLCDTTPFSDVEAGPRAAGVDPGWDAAFMKAIGEALERYAAGVYRESEFERASASELDDAVPPASFVRPDDYAEPDPDEPIAWVPGEHLGTAERVDLPAEFVHFPPTERRHRPSITTGLGLGSSGAGALLSGLYETVERDATMLAWYSTFEPLGLAVDDPGYETLRRRARAENLDATALLVTQDVDVPVVAAAVHREGEWPRFAVGSGADLDPAAAARSALAEALQNWMELRGMGRERADAEETAIARYADLPPEARSFVEVDGEVAAGDLSPGEPPAGADELAAAVGRLDDAGLDAYAARLTTRDVEALGFEAARVLVPEAQPLFIGDRYFGERARTTPRDLGFRPRLDRPPHPYP